MKPFALAPVMLLIMSTSLYASETNGHPGEVNWVGGYVTGIGYGTAKPSGIRSIDSMRAVRAAEVSAFRALAETVNGVRIDHLQTIRDAMMETVTRSRVEGVVRGAQKIRTAVTWDGDIPQAEVELRVCLNKESPQCRSGQSVMSALLAEGGKPYTDPKIEGQQMPTIDASVTETGQSLIVYDSSRPVTGLVLNIAPGRSFERSIFPVVVTSENDGRPLRVYSAKNVKPEVIRTFGVVRYADTVDNAVRDPRLGNNPIIIDVVTISRDSMFVIERKGAKIIEESTRYGNDFLAEAKVIISGR